jgi:glutaconate CoA-transferase subunit A
LAAVPALSPDTAIVHVQRADENGNAHVWGLMGVQKEAAFAARNTIVVAEEIVSESVIRSDPNRTLIPGLIVDAVVHEPFGCHPSYVQGYYDRDNDFYVAWREISQDVTTFNSYLDEWIYGVRDRAEYVQRMGQRLARLKAHDHYCYAVNYGY